MKKHSYQQGQAVIVVTIFLVLISMTIIRGFVSPAVRDATRNRDLESSKQSYFLSESGLEDAAYRLRNNQTISSSETLTLDGSTVLTTITDVSGTKVVTATGTVQEAVRKVQATMTVGSGASFNVGMQTGVGGIVINNNTDIYGNVYSNGPVLSNGQLDIHGSAVSAGPAGLLHNLHVDDDAYAHTITDSSIGGDAFYTTKSNTTVTGQSTSPSPDQPSADLPISDTQISEWETQATAGGVTTCSTQTLSGTITIGPRKYACDVVISENADITLAGPVWIAGNLVISANTNFRVSASQSGKSVALIVDKPTAPTTSGLIVISANVNFYGAGANSYVMLLSQNRSAENSGGLSAISISNRMGGNSHDGILYAGHGSILVNSNTDIKQLTAYKLIISGNFDLWYESGLASVVFTSGPAGAWSLTDWLETE